MCGITGIYAFNEIGKVFGINLQRSLNTLQKRGPDQRGTLLRDRINLGHTRLSIIDTSNNGRQPMLDPSGRYALIFNGEIYNYKYLRKELLEKGHIFQSETDTEVLLYLLIEDGIDALNSLNGFFAFAFYDSEKQEILLARDRFGIKPLYYSFDEDKCIFASELKSVLAYNIPSREIDPTALSAYLQLNYIPGPHSIYKSVKKLLPGHWMIIRKDKTIKIASYYKIPFQEKHDEFKGNYLQAQDNLKHLLEQSVKRRLVADVPLGSFLSGGIDSSILTGLAARHKEGLQTFSVGFPDHPFFDESRHAEEVARHFKTQHTVINLRENDLLENLHESLEYNDEPFADSSVIAYHALCKKARKHLTVALSGDGADELFGGYVKHQAWQMMSENNWRAVMASALMPLLKFAPQSRNNSLSNTFRRIQKLGENYKMNSSERYFSMCKIASQSNALALMHQDFRDKILVGIDQTLSSELSLKRSPNDLNEALYNDMKLVLPNDMLMKVDHASMANSLEVRVPFLDHELVSFVFSLPSKWKANSKSRKKILVDSFNDMLPQSILQRPKHGFEVPLHKWLTKDLQSDLDSIVFNKSSIQEMQLFDWKTLEILKKQLYSHNPGDSAARVWGIYVLLKKVNKV